MRVQTFALFGMLILQQGCGLSGLYAEIPPYEGPGESDAGSDALDEEVGEDADAEVELLDAPTGLGATGAPDGVTLTWSAVEGATGYEVRRDGGAWTDVGDVTTWLDEDAPKGAFDAAPVVTATQGHYGYTIQLEVTQAPTASDPPTATYTVRAIGGATAETSGARTLGDTSWSWEVGPVGGDLTVDPELTGTTPKHIADAPNRRFDFRAVLSQEGVEEPAASDTVEGSGSKAIDIVTGETHVCVLLESGSVVCWGNRADGRLGDGLPLWSDTDGTPQYAPPVRVALPEPATFIEGRMGYYTCSIGVSGDVYCWGRNRNGELGTGSTVSSSLPQKVPGLDSRAERIDVGLGATCVTLELDTKCWGFGVPQVWSLSFPKMLDTIPTLEVGVCGVQDGGFRCWAWGEEMNEVNEPELIEVTDRTAVNVEFVQVSFGADEFTEDVACFCGVSTLGDAHCFDETNCVEDGNATRWGKILSGASLVEAGPRHACAVNSFNGVTCWGDNTKGQLGVGDVAPDGIINRPVEGLPVNVEVLDVSRDFSCALSGSGIVRCWGENRGWMQGFSVLGDDRSAVLEVADVDVVY